MSEMDERGYYRTGCKYCGLSRELHDNPEEFKPSTPTPSDEVEKKLAEELRKWKRSHKHLRRKLVEALVSREAIRRRASGKDESNG
jgi:hypothetical protein